MQVAEIRRRARAPQESGKILGEKMAEICMNTLDYDIEKAWIDVGRPQKTLMLKMAFLKKSVELYADLQECGLQMRTIEIREWEHQIADQVKQIKGTTK